MAEQEPECVEGGANCETVFGDLVPGVLEGVGFTGVLGGEAEGTDVEGEVSGEVGEAGELIGFFGNAVIGGEGGQRYCGV